MIAVLRGHLLEKHPSRLIVDVHGVGYDVQVPVSTFYQAGETGNAVTLRIHTHVREDQIALFGFATALEHDLFERLIAVNGIGPKLALSVLSGIESADFIRAVEQGDVTRLTRMTAEFNGAAAPTLKGTVWTVSWSHSPGGVPYVTYARSGAPTDPGARLGLPGIVSSASTQACK